MNTNNNVQMNQALKSFPLWNQLGAEQRAERLLNSLNALTGDVRKMAQWQINNALTQIAAKQLMPGPTGESNLLSNQGRGVFISLLTPLPAHTDQLFTALIGQVFAALMAGNSVIHLGDLGQDLVSKLEEYLPKGVLQDAQESDKESLLSDSRIAGVCMVSNTEEVIQLQLKLANKVGLLCQLIPETDINDYTTLAQPNYIHKFTTEQTISTNTTAVGGNATLLELGSKTD